MAISGGDRTWVVYQGPPRWDGEKYTNGDRFFLSGHRALQGREGVELAMDWGGLERPSSEYRYDTSVNIPGARLTSVIDGRREVTGGINILGDTPAEVRANKNKWMLNHPDKEPGRLWFFSSNSMPRYLLAVKSETAGLSSLPKDPAIRKLYEGFEWGWTSDDAYFRGYRETKTLRKTGTNTYSRTFFNTSTVEHVYPVLFLPGGPGVQYKVTKGYKRGTFTTPTIAANEEVRINFDPKEATYLKRNIDTGQITNLWPTLAGDRPRLSLEANTKNTFEVEVVSGTPEKEPRLIYVPLYKSWN